MGTSGSGPYGNIGASRDGTRLAVGRITEGRKKSTSGCWISREAAPAHGYLWFGHRHKSGLVAGWSRIIFSSNQDGHFNLFQKSTNGVQDERFCSSPARTSLPRVGRTMDVSCCIQ